MAEWLQRLGYGYNKNERQVALNLRQIESMPGCAFWHPSSLHVLVLQTCMHLEFTPMIVFSFRRRECEAYAMSLSKLDFNSEEEKKMVAEVRGREGRGRDGEGG